MLTNDDENTSQLTILSKQCWKKRFGKKCTLTNVTLNGELIKADDFIRHSVFATMNTKYVCWHQDIRHAWRQTDL